MSEYTFIEDSENFARFILFSRWYVKEDKRVKPEAFMPHPYTLELSVTRTKNLSENELMEICKNISHNRPPATLYGNAKFKALEVRKINLDAVPAPVEGNANHAHVIGWPLEKSKQKSLALEIASKATIELYFL